MRWPVKVLLGVILISGVIWGGLIITETLFNDGRPDFRKTHWTTLLKNSPGRTTADSGSRQPGWLARVFSRFQRPDYSHCLLFYNACFGPLCLEGGSQLSAVEMQRFLSRCLARKGKRDHELAGTAYTLGLKLMEVARQKEQYREELRQVMEREYEILGSSLYRSNRMHYTDFEGEKQSYTVQVYDEEKARQEQESKRRFWAQGVQRRWKDYADKTRPECERYLARIQQLSTGK